MSDPTQYSMETVDLTPTDTSPASALNITASASLMVNYKPCMPVSSNGDIKAIEDSSGHPIIFSVGDDGHLYGVVRDTDCTSGWQQYDLTSTLTSDKRVGAFDAFDLGNDTFVLAVSLNNDTTQTTYLTAPLPHSIDAQTWQGFADLWVERPNKFNIKSVGKLILGQSENFGAPIAMAMATTTGDSFDRYVVSGFNHADDADDSNVGSGDDLWHCLPLAGNTEEILSVKLGISSEYSVAGTYTLFRNGAETYMTFDAVKMEDGQYLSYRFDDLPEGASSLETLFTNVEPGSRYGPKSELFIAASGVFHYPAGSDQRSAGYTQIADALSGHSCTDIAARRDGDTVSIWTVSEDPNAGDADVSNQLNYFESTPTESPTAWTSPMPIQSNVTQISVVRNKTRKNNELFFIDAQSMLSYGFQDTATTIWQQIGIPLTDTGKAAEVPSYTTALHLKDADNLPVITPVSLSATSMVNINVNGQVHMIGPDTWVDVQPDPFGTVTVISEITTSATALLTLRSDSFVEYVDVNPMAIITDNLRPYTDPDAIENGTTQTGEPIIAEGSTMSAGDMAEAIAQLVNACDAAGTTTLKLRTPLEPAANIVDPTKLNEQAAKRQVRSIGMSGLGTPHARAHFGKDVHFLLPPSNPNSTAMMKTGDSDDGTVVTFFGDVWNAITTGLKTVGAWVLNVVEEGLEFVVHLAEGVVSFILETVEMVFQVVFWIADQIGMVLGKFIGWLGQLLGLDGIFTVKDALKNAINAMIDQSQDKIDDLRETCDEGINSLENTLTGHDLPPEAEDALNKSSKQYLSDFEKNTIKAGIDAAKFFLSPIGTLIGFHTQFSMVGDSNDNFPVRDDLADAMETFVQTAAELGCDMLQTFGNVFEDIITGFTDGSMTLGNILSALGDIIAQILDDTVTGILTGIQDVMDGFFEIVNDLIEAAQDLINRVVHIPFFSGFYKGLTGEEPSLIDCTCFMIALPAGMGMTMTGSRDTMDALAPLADPDLTGTQFIDIINGTPAAKQTVGSTAMMKTSGDDLSPSDAWMEASNWIDIGSEAGIYIISFGRAAVTVGKPKSAFVSALSFCFSGASTVSNFVFKGDPAYPMEMAAWVLNMGWMPITFLDIIGNDKKVSFDPEKDGNNDGKVEIGIATGAGIGLNGINLMLLPCMMIWNLNFSDDVPTTMLILDKTVANLGGSIASFVASVDNENEEILSKEALAVTAGIGFALNVAIDVVFAATYAIDDDALDLNYKTF